MIPCSTIRCASPGCGTFLSTYNQESVCWVHTVPDGIVVADEVKHPDVVSRLIREGGNLRAVAA